ncbi:unnamed protein product [Closterium sp. Naga37s-1]|nr:unnamed protein product [Closterium sp. Naga37s-1]
MVKPRNNKAGKKTEEGGRGKEHATNVTDVPVPDAADKSWPISPATPAVFGPFEDLLDLQNKADNVADPGDGTAVDEADSEGHDQGPAKEGAADTDNKDDEEEDLSDPVPEDEDDGYLSDGSDEHLEPASLSSALALKRFSLTLLVPILRKAEVKRAAVTIAALLDDWKDQLTPDVLQTTTYQELTATFFSGTRYGRLQVTFNHVRDANFVWNQVIKHECVNGDIIDLTWQFPEDARFLRERVLNPLAQEVVVKGVPAEISAELIRHLLVVSKLVKRGRSAFASGFGFHRTLDSVSGLDTDLILTSTGGMREEWVCVQTVCEKAQGNRFEQAAAHVASAKHKGGLRTEGAATRASKHSQRMAAFKKDFIVKQSAK